MVDALFEGRLIEGYSPGSDPLALSNLTIWVPTRRAARALASEFVARSEGETALLPNIKMLGDAEDEDFILHHGEGDVSTLMQPIIAPAKRQLILSRLVDGWAQSLNQQQRDLYRGSDIVIPSSLSDAIWFAAELARLMDTIATEEVGWEKLQELVPQDHANWWQLTLEFLKIATTQWPAILEEMNLQDAATQRARILRRQAQVYKQDGSPGPVIAAGSTGSIPATAELLKAIANLDNGAVVLPGLDRDLDNETWEKVDLGDSRRGDYGSAPGHPQFGLKKLLAHLGSARQLQDIVHLGGSAESGAMRLRELLVSEALRPPDSTGHWQELPSKITDDQKEQALQGVVLIEADGDRQEALAIALSLRETLEEPSNTVALITPDRNLARRVAVEMERFGVAVDDSAGQPLRNTSEGKFLRLLLLVAFGPASNLTLVNLLKHPLSLFGRKASRSRHAARLFELVVLRGRPGELGAGSFLTTAKRKHEELQQEKKHVHRAIRRLSAQDWEDLFWLAGKLDAVFAPVEQTEDGQEPVDELTRQTIALVEKCAANHDGYFDELFGTEDGRAVTDFLGELLDHGSLLQCHRNQWPDIFDALMGDRVARSVGRSHSRLAILGPLEARLQTFDRVVLGGLNEKTWPATTRNDAFLSRPMKTALGLPPPERRTGLSAHDFQVLMGSPDVVLTRSTKSDNAPTIASRWLQRLSIVAGDSARAALRRRGQVYLDWVEQIDAPEGATQPCRQPHPTPPVAVRPTGLSITDIETWVMDPYAIYAKRILKLVPLDPLTREADARERGELYHAIVEDFVRLIDDAFAEDALDQLLKLARQRFDQSAIPPEIAVQWWSRFKTIAENLLIWHRQHLQEVDTIHVELKGSTSSGLNGFTLSGRVDRIDLLNDKSLAIFDYKTGGEPQPKSIIEFKSPQLPLEAAMALRGGFGEELRYPTHEFGYIRLRPANELEVDAIGEATSKSPSARELAEETWQRLCNLIEAYRDPDKDYRSKARQAPEKSWESDYDHLARVREWSVVDDEGEGS